MVVSSLPSILFIAQIDFIFVWILMVGNHHFHPLKSSRKEFILPSETCFSLPSRTDPVDKSDYPLRIHAMYGRFAYRNGLNLW